MTAQAIHPPQPSSVMKLRILGQFFTYLFRSGKWWLFPIVLLLLVLGLILVIAKGSALAPFIYTLF
jgi:hypothetical protein